MESNGYDGKKVREDLELIDDKIKDIENEILKLLNLENSSNQVHYKINRQKRVVESLKYPNNAYHDDAQDLDCVIKEFVFFKINLI